MKGGGDGITALYIDGKLYAYGDYYHDKIDDFIRGFVDGLSYAKIEFDYKLIQLEHDNKWVEDVSRKGITSPPENYLELFPEVKYKIPTTKKRIKK